MEIITPENRRQLEGNLESNSQSYSISRGVRFLIRKTSKAFDMINARTAQQTLQLAIQGERLKQLEQKKQKKAAIDSNEQFADIEEFKRAQEAVARQAAAWTRQNGVREARLLSNRLTERRMEDFMFNWQINSVDNA
jgi:hypothetical protein